MGPKDSGMDSMSHYQGMCFLSDRWDLKGLVERRHLETMLVGPRALIRSHLVGSHLGRGLKG